MHSKMNTPANPITPKEYNVIAPLIMGSGVGDGAGTPDAGPTPRSDQCSRDKWGSSMLHVPTDFARTLELELAAARAELEQCRRIARENYDAGNAYMEISTVVRGKLDAATSRAEAAEQEAERLRGQVAVVIANQKLLEEIVAKLKGQKL